MLYVLGALLSFSSTARAGILTWSASAVHHRRMKDTARQRSKVLTTTNSNLSSKQKRRVRDSKATPASALLSTSGTGQDLIAAAATSAAPLGTAQPSARTAASKRQATRQNIDSAFQQRCVSCWLQPNSSKLRCRRQCIKKVLLPLHHGAMNIGTELWWQSLSYEAEAAKQLTHYKQWQIWSYAACSLSCKQTNGVCTCVCFAPRLADQLAGLSMLSNSLELSSSGLGSKGSTAVLLTLTCKHLMVGSLSGSAASPLHCFCDRWAV